ncbi:OpgC family protein [Nitratireductor sp. ZSWI3]|uniref:OpgC family protein n=1 Tax=Nitratireductor sp. ZSWI3 TaxID=2966359 RepID=UPI0021501CF8|nr:OpgC domain-containing protein [Nitratireductor sp. ZSWI3]MCR4265895.1 OpgC domain-containing protein [Nitratireductor sp. ZSWI3]
MPAGAVRRQSKRPRQRAEAAGSRRPKLTGEVQALNAPLVPIGHGRDQRLDVFRGLALITIFINHVPGNVYELLTSRNFGFSDAAEAFVLMSGIAVGLAYSRGFSAGPMFSACMRVWRRAGVLYVTHIVSSVIAIALVAAGVLFLGTVEMIGKINFARLLDQPLQAMVGIPLLGHQLGYFNILPLYAVLLVISPLYILIGLRSRRALVGVALLVWLVAGMFRLNMPNYPNPGGWFFNPFSWQLIYAIGIAGGLSMLEKRKLVPFRAWLFWASTAFLVFSCAWVQLRVGAIPGGDALPFFIGTFDKTFVSLPRLLHALALAYVLTNVAWVMALFRHPVFRPIELMGKNGLAVFAAGSVLAIVLQVLRVRFETDFVSDAVLLGGGLAIQYGIARFLSAQKALAGKKKALATEAPYHLPSAGKPRLSESA